MKTSALIISLAYSLITCGLVFGARYGSDEPGEVSDMLHRTSADGVMWGLDGYTENVTIYLTSIPVIALFL